MDIVNTTTRPKAIKQAGQYVVVKAGARQALDIDLSKSYRQALEAAGLRFVDGSRAQAPEASATSRAELKSMADDLGLDYAQKISTARLQALVDKATASA